MKVRIINESDFDDYGYELDDYSQGTTYEYKIDYYTYYRNSTDKEVPLCEVEKVSLFDLPMDDTSEIDKEAESIKRCIDGETNDGEWPGLWVHHITIVSEYDYKKLDVDDWTESSYVNKEESGYDSEELELPEDWDYNNPDYDYLVDYVTG